MPQALLIGNSDGIGRVVTHRLLEQGWQVLGISRSPLATQHPNYLHHVGDVSTEAFGELLQSLQESNEFDLCIYFAGIGHTLDLDHIGQEEAVFQVNLLGLVRTVEGVVPGMIRAGKGHLIALSSLCDILISKDAPSYFASKAGMSNYLKGLYLNLKPKGIAVTNVRFGFVDTKMAQGAVKPMMISCDRAAEVILRAIRKRPATLSYPQIPRLLAQCARVLLGILFLCS